MIPERARCYATLGHPSRGSIIKRAAIFIVLALTLAPVVQAAETLRAVAFIPRNDPLMVQALQWIRGVNSALEGRLQIEFLGGPEIFPRQHQIEAVRNGIVEMTFTVTSDYQDELPEVSAFTLSRLSPSEERDSGFYDRMVMVHERINVRYLGRMQYLPFYVFVKERPSELAELRGMKIRTGSLYNRFIRELGMVPVTISSSETYAALERGVVDGFAWPSIGPRQRGWLEEVRYVIDLPFFSAGNAVALMNLDAWNGLPLDVRDDLIRATANFEPRMVAYYRNADAEEQAEMAKAGLTRIVFPDNDNQTYLDAAYRVEWDKIAERVPNLVHELKQISGNQPAQYSPGRRLD